VDIDEGDKYDGNLDLGPREHAGDELGELCVAVDVLGVRGGEGGDATECKVYRLDSALHDIV